MEYREFTCLYCGARSLDTSRTKNRKFCNDHCNQAYWYRTKRGKGGKTQTPTCIHSIHILCGDHKCSTCGWNPKVEKERKEALGYG